MSQPDHTLKHTLTLAAGAICISFAPIFLKFALAEGMGPTNSAFWRLLIGGLVFLGLALALGGSLKVTARLTWGLIAGMVFACDLFVWHKSVAYIGAGMATILGNMQVFPTSILGRYLYKEKLSTVFKIAVPLAVVGVILLTGVGSDIEFTPRYLWGVALGLMTAVFYAGYIISLKNSSRDKQGAVRKMSQRETMTLLGWISLTSAALLAGATAIEGQTFVPTTPQAWAHLAAVALVAQVAGWLLIYKSLSHLPASRSALILLLQPTFATIWGAIFFDETLGLLQLFGAALTLSAIYLGGARR
ncbi:MAG TPA: DMT family transporter [candidate division Zixibacteria bacterium]|nr:DMT family transporter [candidate division Zixibacteria bacterium]